MDDEEWIEAEMDEYFHQQPEEEYIDPNEYSYVDPRTGLTPKQQAYLDYRDACEEYEYNWIGTPYMERPVGPPRWEDFWQEPINVAPQPVYHYEKPKLTKAQKISIGILIGLFVVSLIALIVMS